MIRLFISDIDGCLAEPYQPYALPQVQRLARRINETEPPAPRFTVCSGRAYPYVEAVTQVFGLQEPVLFESGGGLFDPVAARVTWNPGFTDEVAAEVKAVRHWLVHECLPGTSMMYDYGKRTQAGIIGPVPEEVARQVPVVESHVAAHHPELRVFHTDVSIDVVPADITKEQAIHWLAERLEIDLDEIAYIGDTNGDLEALETVGYAFAPANATEAVKAAVPVTTDGAVIKGVLEAYQWCRSHNRRVRAKAS